MRSRFENINNKIWSNEFSRGGIILTASAFIINLLNYLFNLLSGRLLGPKDYGEIVALFSYTTIFSVPMLVITAMVIQKIGERVENRKYYVRALEVWFNNKIKKWFVLALLTLTITPFIPRLTNLSTITAYILLPFLLLNLIASFYGAIMQGIRLFEYFSVLSITATIIKFLGIAAVFFGVDGLTTVVIFILLAQLMGTFLSHHIIITRLTKQLSKNDIEVKITRSIRNIISSRGFAVTFLSILGITLFNNLDIIFVKKMFSAFDAGIYSSWSLFAKIIFFAMGPFISVSFVFFAQKDTQSKQKKILHISLLALCFIAIASFIVYKLFSVFIINLFFGMKFITVLPFMARASLFGSFYTAVYYVNSYFLAREKKAALILPMLMPFYAGLLFMARGDINRIINLNIYFSAFVTLVYLAAYWWQELRS